MNLINDILHFYNWLIINILYSCDISRKLNTYLTEINDENVSDDITAIGADLMSNIRELTKDELNIFPNP